MGFHLKDGGLIKRLRIGRPALLRKIKFLTIRSEGKFELKAKFELEGKRKKT
jgi:hypothetical protein